MTNGENPPPSRMVEPAAVTPRRVFATTRWSVVLRAGHAPSAEARDALARLCGTYWYPLYAHVRRRGHAPHDAQDLTQGFFEHLLRHGIIGRADPARGRFRSFLLTALNHFLADEWQKQRAGKRGGGHPVLSLDVAAAERRLDLEPVARDAPDRAFDRRWAVALLDTVLQRLAAEFAQEGKTEFFARLKSTLLGTSAGQPYAALAAQLGMSEGAVKVAVHRLRRRYRELLQAEIAETVASAEDAGAELRHLFRALADE